MKNTDFNAIQQAYRGNMFAGEDRTDILELYKALPDKNITGDDGETLYHLSASFADIVAIEYLSGFPGKPQMDSYGNTPLHSLAKSPLANNRSGIADNEDAIKKVTLKLVELKVNAKRKNDSGEPAYVEAVKREMYPMVEALAEAGVKMDYVGEEGKNMLHLIAYRAGHRKGLPEVVEASGRMVKALLLSGVDPEDKDIFDTTPLAYTQQSGIKELAAILNGDGSSMETGGMTLEQAVLNKDIEALAALLDRGNDVNEVSETGYTPLMRACEYPSPAIAELLMEKGADVNYKSGENEHTAVYWLFGKAYYNLNTGVVGGQSSEVIVKILRQLIKAGLLIDDRVDSQGNTPLSLLCSSDSTFDLTYRMAEELLDGGADPDVANIDGTTPLMLWAGRGNEMDMGIAELLLDNGADTKMKDSRSNTALMHAAQNSNKMSGRKIMELILGMDSSTVHFANNAGETAVDIAVKNGNEAAAKLLLNYL